MAKAQEVRMLAELSAIAGVREAIARAEWNEAESHRQTCEDQERDAGQQALDAFEDWSACVGSSLLGPGSIRSAAGRVIAEELALSGARKQHEAAAREAGEKGSTARLAKAGAEADTKRLARARRRHEVVLDEARMSELDDLMLARRLGKR
ncbi:hypothetical protein [Sphingomonas sp.]|uniref:hypothetical protein n=1 Tax=Sphingomonas sp. TaxID=28214 RepID=UPI0025E9D9EA|nr:hypothetical protein [Sphingomonas sp.]